MFQLKKKELYKIYTYLSSRRKKQLILLLIIIFSSGLFEAFSIASAIPFLALLSSPDKIYNNNIINIISNFFDINRPSELFLPITILFGILVFSSTIIRLLNLWFISFFTAKIEIDLSNILIGKNLYQTYSEYTKKVLLRLFHS